MTQVATDLKRTLKTRHLTMIALGGSIGTGLFLASGATISQAGPLGALLAYGAIGLMVYFLMTSLGELSAWEPTSGAFAVYGEKYVDEGFGFAIAMNYWYNWAIAVAVDLVAAQLVMQYWFPSISGWVWSGLFLGLIVALNYFSVATFGEAEFWFAAVKVTTIIIFIALGLLMITGILSGGPETVFTNWSVGEGPIADGLMAFMGVAMVVGYSFQGTELVGVAAGESEKPRENIPKSIRQIFWRILLFYLLSIFVIGLLLPYTDPRLLKNDLADIAVSPFTLIFERAGLLSAAALMNAVILTTVLSAGNSGMYAATRMLHTMALQGKVPRYFAATGTSGVPRRALWATTAFAALCFLTSVWGDQTVYLWLLNTTGMGGFILWAAIAVCHYRFRKGYLLAGGCLEDLPYRAPFFPYGPLLAFVVCLVIAAGQNYAAFMGESWDWTGILATYIGLIVFVILWWGYRFIKGSRFVRYEDMRFEKET